MRLTSIALAVVLAACKTDVSDAEPGEGRGEPEPGETAGTPGTRPAPGSDAGGSSRPPFAGETRTGIATYYDADGSGNCSFDPSPDDLDVVALSDPDYAGSATCGACAEVTGEKGTVTVRVVDRCPGCEADHLDLSREAFAKIDDPKDGRVPITYRLVACATTGPMAYRFKEGSSKYWTGIQVRNHKVPIAKLEFEKAGAFVEMARQNYNYFVASKGVGDTPSGLTLRVTSVDGQVVTDTLPGVLDAETATGSAQFE